MYNSTDNKKNEDAKSKKSNNEKLILLKEENGFGGCSYSIFTKEKDSQFEYEPKPVNEFTLEEKFGIKLNDPNIENTIYGKCVIIQYHKQFFLNFRIIENMVLRNGVWYMKLHHTEVYNKHNLVVNCLTENDKLALKVLNLYGDDIEGFSQLNLLSVYYANLPTSEKYPLLHNYTWLNDTRLSLEYRPKRNTSLTFIDTKFNSKVRLNQVSGVIMDSYIENSLIMDLNISYEKMQIINSSLYTMSNSPISIVDLSACKAYTSIKMLIVDSKVNISFNASLKYLSHSTDNNHITLLFNDQQFVNKFKILDSKVNLLYITRNLEMHKGDSFRVDKNIQSLRTPTSGEWFIELSTSDNLKDLLKDNIFTYSLDILRLKNSEKLFKTLVTCINTDLTFTTGGKVGTYGKKWCAYIENTFIPLEKFIIDRPFDSNVDPNIVEYSNNNIRNFLRLLENNDC